MDENIINSLEAEIVTGKSNCIIVTSDDVFRFSLPGVKTLLTLLKEDPSLLKDSVVFDKIVGKGAAALLILGKVKKVYAELISDNAIALLNKHAMNFSYGERVPFIQNKSQTGLCPIESLAITSDDPSEIHLRIRDFISSVKS